MRLKTLAMKADARARYVVLESSAVVEVPVLAAFLSGSACSTWIQEYFHYVLYLAKNVH